MRLRIQGLYTANSRLTRWRCVTATIRLPGCHVEDLIDLCGLRWLFDTIRAASYQEDHDAGLHAESLLKAVRNQSILGSLDPGRRNCYKG